VVTIRKAYLPFKFFLQCFAERLIYNRELEVFEEFIQKLADDVGKGDAKAASQLRQFTHFKGTIYNVADNQSRIGYYVTVLNKVQGLEFVKKHRLPLFLRSELYAEYKLSKHLSAVQVSIHALSIIWVRLRLRVEA